MADGADMALENAFRDLEHYERFKDADEQTQYDEGLIDEQGYTIGEPWLAPAGAAYPVTRRRKTKPKKARIVICPYCGKPAEHVDSSVVYGRSFGKIYLCRCVPGWAYVGCNKVTGEPLGTLADNETREWRKMAHAAFDPLWKDGGAWRRGDAYSWLSSQLGIPQKQCHIGMFDVDRCKRVIDACRCLKYGHL